MRWSVLAGGAAWLAVAGLLSACASTPGAAPEKRLAMAPISYNEIPGWADDRHGEALVAFRRSCPKLTTGPDTKIATDGGEKTITPAEWRNICDSAAAVKAGDERAARLLRGQFPAAGRPVSGQVHRLLRARAARQQGAVASLHGAGLSQAARSSRRQALLHARRDREWRAEGQRPRNRLRAGPGGDCSKCKSKAAAASSSPKAGP